MSAVCCSLRVWKWGKLNFSLKDKISIKDDVIQWTLAKEKMPFDTWEPLNGWEVHVPIQG